LATWSSSTRWQCSLLRQDCPSENAEEEEFLLPTQIGHQLKLNGHHKIMNFADSARSQCNEANEIPEHVFQYRIFHSEQLQGIAWR
jgi:hypothetical protein